jgi:hypothetical protein
MSYLNSSIEYGTLEPQTTTKEFVSFTGITQNSDGSATLTGVTRGLSFSYPYTASTTLQQSHPAQSIFILSNPPQLTNQYANKSNDDTITGSWSFPTPLAGANPATKAYVDAHVNGGPVSYNQVVVAGTAGETVSAGQFLYLKSDGGWYKAAINIPSASSTETGIAQGAGTLNNPITGGVLISGLDSNQSGLIGGTAYYGTATAGAIGTAVSGLPLGRAASATSIFFDPKSLDVGLGFNNTFSGQNTFTSTTTLTATSSTIGAFPAWQIGKQEKIFSTTGTTTFSVPSGITQVTVQVQGAGGGGGGSNTGTAGFGGGAGGYSFKQLTLVGTSTVQVFVGSGGTGSANASGTNGTWSTFGTNGFYLSASGGAGGVVDTNGATNAGGVGAGGDINIAGDSGGAGVNGTNPTSGVGGSAMWGGGGSGTFCNSGACGGANAGNYGGGGGGAASNSGTGVGGSGGQGIVIVSW